VKFEKPILYCHGRGKLQQDGDTGNPMSTAVIGAGIAEVAADFEKIRRVVNDLRIMIQTKFSELATLNLNQCIRECKLLGQLSRVSWNCVNGA
jgi:hypothetical protein